MDVEGSSPFCSTIISRPCGWVRALSKGKAGFESRSGDKSLQDEPAGGTERKDMGGRNPWPDVPRKDNGTFKSRGGCMLLLIPVLAAALLMLWR